MAQMRGEKIEVEGVNIHYEKVGNGSDTLLLLPGALGTTRTDFDGLLEGGLSQSKFTLIAWDPPGYGFSRPPTRKYDRDVYKTDADLAAALMKKLGYSSYSILGWSDGGKTGIHLASKYPSVVDKLVVWGVVPYGLPHTNRAFFVTKNMSFWDPDMKKRFEAVYGKDLEYLWNKLVDDCAKNLGECMSIVPDEAMKSVQCPALVMHGDKDPMVALEHAQHVAKCIPDSQLHRFPKASHNGHQTFEKEFCKIVTNFLYE